MDNAFQSDLVMGEKYKDNTTGIEGTLVAVHFYQHACERATLRYVNKHNEVTEVSFDAPELVNLATKKLATATRPGGPARSEGRRAE